MFRSDRGLNFFLPSGVRHVKNIYSFRLFTWETEIRPSCPEDGCNISLRNVGNHLAEFRVLSQPELIKIRTVFGNEKHSRQTSELGSRDLAIMCTWKGVFSPGTSLKPHRQFLVRRQRFSYLQPTPCSRALLEKLAVAQLLKKCPAFYGTTRFITVSTKARHESRRISWNWWAPVHGQRLCPHNLQIY